ISTIDVVSEVSDNDATYNSDSLVTIASGDLDDDELTVKYTSNFAGEVKFYFGIDNAYDPATDDTPKKASSVSVEFVEDNEQYNLEVVGDYDTPVDADGISNHE